MSAALPTLQPEPAHPQILEACPDTTGMVAAHQQPAADAAESPTVRLAELLLPMGTLASRGSTFEAAGHPALARIGLGNPATWRRVSDKGTTTEVFITGAGYLRVPAPYNPTGVHDLAAIYELLPAHPRLPQLLGCDLGAEVPWILEQAMPGVAVSRHAGPLDVPAVLAELMEVLCAIHQVGEAGPSVPAAAVRLDVHRSAPYTEALYRQTGEIFGHQLAERLAERYAQLPPTSSRVLIHADATANNVLICPQTGSFAGLVDFEWAHVNSPIYDLLPLVAGATRHFHYPNVEATIDLYVRSCPHIDAVPTVADLVALLAVREAASGCWDVASATFPEEILAARLAERRRRMEVLLAALADL